VKTAEELSRQANKPPVNNNIVDPELPRPTIELSNRPKDQTYEDHDPCCMIRPVMVVADGIGESTMHSVCAIIRSSSECWNPSHITLHQFVTSSKRLREKVTKAAEKNAVIVASINDQRLYDLMVEMCASHEVPLVFLNENLLDSLETFLGSPRSRLSLGDPKRHGNLSDQYYRMVAAVEYTIRQDDGAQLSTLHEADLVLVGVSRTSKTALCTYLMHHGLKVANVPLVPTAPPPKELLEMDQSRVIALEISAAALMAIRRKRAGTSLGMDSDFTYAHIGQIKAELLRAKDIYKENGWTSVNVTGAGCEETAERIIELWEEQTGRNNPGRFGAPVIPSGTSYARTLPVLKHPETGSTSKAPPPKDQGARNIRPRSLLVISECSGESAAHAVHSHLGQFDHCIHTTCVVDVKLYRFVETRDEVFALVNKASEDDAILIYTFAQPHLRKAMAEALEQQRVGQRPLRTVDLWGPTQSLCTREGVIAPFLEGAIHKSMRGLQPLSKEFFKVVEAIEFTVQHDDGNLSHNLRAADLVIVGVSRSSKTPICMYLAQRGFKVANVPLVPGVPPPPELFKVDPSRVVALTIEVVTLATIRTARLKRLGVEAASSPYIHREAIRSELQDAKKLYVENPGWSVVDVTDRAVEESAAMILRIMKEQGTKIPAPIVPQWSSYSAILPQQHPLMADPIERLTVAAEVEERDTPMLASIKP